MYCILYVRAIRSLPVQNPGPAEQSCCCDRVNATHVIQSIWLHLKLLDRRGASDQRLCGRHTSTVARGCQPHGQSVRTTDRHVLPSIQAHRSFKALHYLESRIARYECPGRQWTSRRALSFQELGLDFGGALDMAFQSSPAVLYHSALGAARQLHQILVEALLLYFLELRLSLHCARSALHARALYLCLSCLHLAVCARIVET
jgi:hypothetical protein